MLVHSQVLGLAVYSSLSLSPHTQGPPAPHELLLENWMQPCPRWADTMAGELDALVVAVSLSPVPHKEAVERSRTICFPFSPFFLTWCAPPESHDRRVFLGLHRGGGQRQGGAGDCCCARSCINACPASAQAHGAYPGMGTFPRKPCTLLLLVLSLCSSPAPGQGWVELP